MPGSIETAPNTQTEEAANPFLQFVDPGRYRELVEFANKHTEPGRLICPLSHPVPRPTKAPIDRATGLRGR